MIIGDVDTVASPVLAPVRQLQDGWAGLDEAASLETLRALQRQACALSESAAEHGYRKVADLAGIIDVMLAPLAEGEETFTREFKDILRDYLEALVKLSAETPCAPRPEVVEAVGAQARRSLRVLILEAEETLADELSHQIAHFGYSIETAATLDELLALLAEETPEAVVMDVLLPEEELSLSEAAQRVRELGGEDLPLLFLTERGDIESRLRAARAGADAYVLKPVDVHELVDQLDKLTTEQEKDPFHIVIVEDSSTQAIYYSTILKRAGMHTTVVNDSIRVLEVLDEAAADLILMDMYMPGCSGTELATVIRQVPRYASIPIVFLSAETQLERQLDAMSLGGDDFLTKPISPAHLIRSVAIRAERARILRSLMLTDNLTGLLNHTSIKEQLHNEVARAARRGGTLSFAMIDIDHFKSVNDTHGHPVGDRVIKTLARVLQQRLRKTDYIGRYGGEEFAVILPDADAPTAAAIVDQVRKSFGKIRQFSSEGVFACSFSAGVASFPDCPDAVEVALEADKALYAAKHAGRNTVSIAVRD
ncbi:diguanylate cyclase [Alkalilimnicola sp. S0819]|uniref:diguanylate cyclase n=1 Tax=Alkalilimnicola sp. S0819 TaxID=2613922 RepID=UPI00186A5A29|nr:diguanylate cyclase [Alkalilimnicola sp. S0819]